MEGMSDRRRDLHELIGFTPRRASRTEATGSEADEAAALQEAVRDLLKLAQDMNTQAQAIQGSEVPDEMEPKTEAERARERLSVGVRRLGTLTPVIEHLFDAYLKALS